MQADPWSNYRQHTTARIALGRAGGSLPTRECLSFAADHADARDAVYSELDLPALQRSLDCQLLQLRSQAVDRAIYLQRPDLGRRLHPESADQLRSINPDPTDVTLILADGLSASAAQRHAAGIVLPLVSLLNSRGFSLAPLCVVQQGRVAIEDEIGSLLRTRVAVILIGERPGLGTADSLGAYLVHSPAVGKTDADRNCISNIHPRHLPPAKAAEILAWLIEQSLVRRLSGVDLKDDRPELTGEIGSVAPPAVRINPI